MCFGSFGVLCPLQPQDAKTIYEADNDSLLYLTDGPLSPDARVWGLRDGGGFFQKASRADEVGGSRPGRL